MSIGTTSTFSQTRDQIIADALTNVGALGPGGTPDGDQLTHAARCLSRLVKSLDADGAPLWKTVRRTFSTTAATASYLPAGDVMALDEPLTYMAATGTNRSQIRPMSRDDYENLTDRTTAGVPSQYLVERTISGSGQEQLSVTFWPVPSVTADTIEYPAILRRLDYTDGSTHSDFPTKWIECLVLGLSSQLGFAYGAPDLGAQFKDLFENEKAKQMGGDNEGGNLTFVPFGGSGY